jgi:regulator of replication initiation timing
MIKSNVRTKQLDSLVTLVNAAYADNVRIEPDQADEWRQWRDHLVRRLHSVYKPSARPYAGLVVAEVAESLGDHLLDALGEWESLRDKGPEIQDGGAFKAQVEDLESENAALSEEVGRLRERLACRPKTTKVIIPKQTVVVRSRLQQEILRLMGREGLGRSWKIFDGVIKVGLTQERNSIRNALRTLIKRQLVVDYQRNGKIVRWKIASGGSRRLVLLTKKGTAWCQEAFDKDLPESELLWAVQRHRSIAHGVGILEARDHLRAAGHRVNDEPEAILARTQERWGERMEPDLVVWVDDKPWPVEVQREVSNRLLDKWRKGLELVGRLVLVLFSEQHCARQAHILKQARRKLPRGEIRLANLEAMERGNWQWMILNS